MKNFFNRYRNGDRALGSRLSTMTMAISLLDSSKKNNFVETGTTRKNIFTHPKVEDRAADGSSTLFFADYANRYGGRVWTCDIEHQNIENCKIATKEYENLKDGFTWNQNESLETLSTPERIEAIKREFVNRTNKSKTKSHYLIDILDDSEEEGCASCFI